MLSQADLTWLRAAALLPDTCYVLRPASRVSDGEGGWTTTPTRTGPIACVYGPLTTADAWRGGGAQLAATATATCALPAETDVRTTDTLEIHLNGLDDTILTVQIVQVTRVGQEYLRVAHVLDLRPT